MKNKINAFFVNLESGMVKEPRTAVAIVAGMSFLLGVYFLMTILEMVRVSQNHEWISFVLMIPIFVFMLAIMIGLIRSAMMSLFSRFEETDDEDRD